MRATLVFDSAVLLRALKVMLAILLSIKVVTRTIGRKRGVESTIVAATWAMTTILVALSEGLTSVVSRFLKRHVAAQLKKGVFVAVDVLSGAEEGEFPVGKHHLVEKNFQLLFVEGGVLISWEPFHEAVDETKA